MSKTRCVFCKSHVRLTFHHALDYGLVRIFLEETEGKPKDEWEHRGRQNRIRRIKHEGGVMPACDDCHKAWEKIIKRLKRRNFSSRGRSGAPSD